MVTSNLLTNIYFGFHLPRVVMFLLTVLWDPSSPLFGSTIHQVGHFSSQQNFLPKSILIQKILWNGLFDGPSEVLTILALSIYLLSISATDNTPGLHWYSWLLLTWGNYESDLVLIIYDITAGFQKARRSIFSWIGRGCGFAEDFFLFCGQNTSIFEFQYNYVILHTQDILFGENHILQFCNMII